MYRKSFINPVYKKAKPAAQYKKHIVTFNFKQWPKKELKIYKPNAYKFRRQTFRLWPVFNPTIEISKSKEKNVNNKKFCFRVSPNKIFLPMGTSEM